ncbi:F0F1 ATP synthase subunit delta [Arthrobacter sp. JZ12]|uniref:F0F1 ATP synthase subunit delta n=1 Tax=Arthrobacter sp. JZ12 TaxID=2654190 RepID=UPI002B49E0F1|nr:F0F1 ATP synthase subunit delta [Arthrobacter sp. JZ12]WRH25248.1 F0F1 ATP synthase subunit delta [Arthrobacter sp. JZ12]
MAGVSSQSLAEARHELEPRLRTASLTLAEELFGVLDALDSNAGLRRALTDPNRAAEDKVALATSLFSGRISPEAAEIVRGLVAGRWAKPRDLGDALESLAATVAIAVAENRGQGVLGLEGLENDLFSFLSVVESSHDVQRALSEPQADGAAKSALALRLVPTAGEEARLLIRQAVLSPRGLKPSALVQRFIELVALRQERWIANVSVTRPLSDEQFVRLQAGLNRLYGRDLKVNVSVDPSLVGGVRVKVGDEVVDATAVARLAELRRKMAV